MSSSVPSFQYYAVTPNDSTDLPSALARGLYIGASGDLTVCYGRGGVGQTTFYGVIAGTVLPIQCARVKATGTTAGNIVALS
jgi:ABC-type taurine transport system ATPase subunit